jgi:hypothetical protein
MKISNMQQFSLVIFVLCLIINIKPFSSKQNFENIMKDLRSEFENYTDSLNERRKEIQTFESNSGEVEIPNLSNFKLQLNDSNALLKRMNIYLENLQMDVSNSKNIFEKMKSEKTSINKKRIDSGLSHINKVLVNILRPDIVKETLEDLYSKIFENKTTANRENLALIEKKIVKSNLRKLKNSLGKLFPRAWSSWRIDELLLDLQERVHIKGVWVMKACLTGIINNVNPAVCFKNQDIFTYMSPECPENYEAFGTSCLAKCQDRYEFSGGLCLKSCNSGNTDCGSFCSKSHSCSNFGDLSAKEVYVPKFLTISDPEVNCKNDYYKSGMLCHRKCELFGMVDCDNGTCATSKVMCNKTQSMPSSDFIEKYVQFFGFVASSASDKPFGNYNQDKYFKTLDALADYSRKNSRKNNEIILMLRKIANDKLMKEDFSARVGLTSTFKFSKIDDKEKERISSICKNVASNLLDFLNNKKNENEFSFDFLKNRKIILDYRPCTDGKPFKSRELCKDIILSLITQLAPFDLLSLSTEFSNPVCIFPDN